MKKIILLSICFFCLLTSTFAGSLNGAPSISGGIKFNNLSTDIQVTTASGKQYNLIDWAGLKDSNSFAIDFNYEWYHSNHPIYFGIAVDLDVGNITTFDPGFKIGYYNDYINLFCKLGISGLAAEIDATNTVYWSKNGKDYYKIDSISFNGGGYNFGLGLDVHLNKKPFFIRLSYDYENYNPDIEINASGFTEKTKSSDIKGDTNFSNTSFTIAVGWQFKRKNIVAYDSGK